MFGVSRGSRARSLAVVLAAHGLAVWLVLSFAHGSFIREREAVVDVFDVRPVEPPPPVEPPEPVAPAVSAKLPGASAPARPLERQPQPEVPWPVAAGIVPATPGETAPVPDGGQDQNGSGAGTGDAGTGRGSAGSGAGGLGPTVAPRLRGGQIAPRDYPRAAAGAQGIVVAHVDVGVDGRVTGCNVARSSGNAILDSTTCRLIRERFRFTPARNARGEAVPGEFGWQQRWWRD